jgi:hypothetical protein
MARTKADVKNGHALRARRANEMAAVAQCMDGHLRNQNLRMEQIINDLRTHMRLKAIKHRDCERRLQRRIRDLEQGWEELANSLTDALEELEIVRRANVRMSEQLLDQEDTELEELSE